MRARKCEECRSYRTAEGHRSILSHSVADRLQRLSPVIDAHSLAHDAYR